MSKIMLVCGLGNPGAEFELTRHNAGFSVVDELATRNNVRYWKSEEGCLCAECSVVGHEVLLVKPQSFMNTSGGPLTKLMRARHVGAAQLLVVHDEVDLPAGEVRVKQGGGLNAHNGLRSIAAKLATREFARLRVGIGRPPGRMSVADWTLRTLKGAYADEFAVTIACAADMVERCLSEGIVALVS